MRRLIRELPFILLSAAAVAMAGVLVLVMSGRFVSDPAAEPEHAAAAPKAHTGTTAAPAAKTTTTVATHAAAVESPSPTKTRLTVTATRGDSWMEVRRSSATGAVLFSGILRKGESQAFSSRRLWLRLGAAGNVDVVVDGKEQPVPTGTPELTLPA